MQKINHRKSNDMMGFLYQTKLTEAGPADPAAPPEDAVLDSVSLSQLMAAVGLHP